MATKINESVWGAVPESGAAIRTAPNTLGTCYNNGTFDPDDINSMDKSIVPWGVPYCGIGGMSYLKKLRMPIPVQGGATKVGTLSTFEIEEFVETNNPITFMMTNNINDPSSANWFSHRMSGAVNSSTTAFTSNAAYDRDRSIPDGSSSQYMWQFKPIVYLDYQKVIVQVQAVILWDKIGGSLRATGNLSTIPASGRTWDDYELIGFTYSLYYGGIYGGWSVNNSYYSIIPLNEKNTSKYVLDRYFGQEVRPEKWSPYTYGVGEIKTITPNNQFRIYSNTITKEADSETLFSGSWVNELKSLGNYINGSQTFDDISYTMQKSCGFESAGAWFEIVEGQELPGTENNGAQIQVGVYYKIKGYEPGTSKADAWINIIAHEIAFLGLPFQIRLNGNAGEPARTATIADSDVYLPIFDMDHMVTTGRYTTDLAEKQALPNYTWNNVFDSTIPNWDSSYNPPKPGPGPEPGGETPWDDNPITRIQEGYWTGFGGNTYVSSARDFEDSFKMV